MNYSIWLIIFESTFISTENDKNRLESATLNTNICENSKPTNISSENSDPAIIQLEQQNQNTLDNQQNDEKDSKIVKLKDAFEKLEQFYSKFFIKYADYYKLEILIYKENLYGDYAKILKSSAPVHDDINNYLIRCIFEDEYNEIFDYLDYYIDNDLELLEKFNMLINKLFNLKQAYLFMVDTLENKIIGKTDSEIDDIRLKFFSKQKYFIKNFDLNKNSVADDQENKFSVNNIKIEITEKKNESTPDIDSYDGSKKVELLNDKKDDSINIKEENSKSSNFLNRNYDIQSFAKQLIENDEKKMRFNFHENNFLENLHNFFINLYYEYFNLYFIYNQTTKLRSYEYQKYFSNNIVKFNTFLNRCLTFIFFGL
ncbi:hypothetical protein GVAV_003455 [Gurleya vavrai]